MGEVENEIETRRRLATEILNFFNSLNLKITESEAGNSASQIAWAYDLGMEHNSIWDYDKEKQKIDNIVHNIDSLVKNFRNLHPKIIKSIEVEYAENLNKYIFNKYDRKQWPFDNTIKMKEDDNYVPFQINEIYFNNIINHLDLINNNPISKNILLNAFEKISPDIDVNEGKSINKWKKINLINAARIVWQKHTGKQAPKSLASDYQNDFADFLVIIFDTFNIKRRDETLRAAMDSWRKSYPN